MNEIAKDSALRHYHHLALARGTTAAIVRNSHSPIVPRPVSAVLVFSPGLAFLTTAAQAEVTISSAATSNMSCSNGVCAPTAKDAVLNVDDLETLLASGNLEVATTGTGVQADDIRADAAISWSGTNALFLDAYGSISVDKPVSVLGQGGLSLATDDGGSGGTLLFGAKGNVTFANLSSALVINGAPYTPVNTLSALAGAIAANPSGAYALAESYNASRDGTYSSAPIPTTFTGNFNGLGNAISNLTIDDVTEFDSVGLFGEIGAGGNVASVSIMSANFTGVQDYIGGLVGINEGTIENAFVAGALLENPNNSTWNIGGLVSWNFGGTIVQSSASAKMKVTGYNGAGGLVGASTGSIVQSYATGAVSAGEPGYAGGLVDVNDGNITQCYSTGPVSGQHGATTGGLVSVNGGTVTQAYSTGRVKDSGYREDHGYKGGLIGYDDSQSGSISDAYWDTTTSHVKNQRRGAGYPKNDPGIAGLTTEQLQSRLPKGFDPKVWAENPKINNGLPYLIANPPEKK
ncbi:MAG: hypothetical protein ACREHV_12565 [Rhizomicrobium sp.]